YNPRLSVSGRSSVVALASTVHSSLSRPRLRSSPGSSRQPLGEKPRDRPRSIGRVRDHGMGDAPARVVHASERNARIRSFQHHNVARLIEPEAEAVTPRPSPHIAAWPHELRDYVRGDDPSGEK